jgi:hypothetical protein
MGQAFSGPKAFEFFGFTTAATNVLKADPALLVTLILVILGMISLSLIAWYIHFVTNKVYYKPKLVKDAKGGGKK